MTNKDTPTLSYWATAFGLVLVALTPCIISFNLYFPYITGKAFYFRTIVMLLVATYLFAAWQTRQLRVRLSPMMAAFTLLLVTSSISAALAVDGTKSVWSNFERMEGVVGLAALWLLFVIAGSVWRSAWSWVTYAYAWLAVAAIMALRGVYEMIVALQDGLSVRVDSFLGNATYFAATMLLSICLAVALHFVPQLLKYRWVGYVSVPLFFISLLGTGTRGTVIGLIAGIIIGVVLYAFGKGASKRLRLVAVGLPILAAVAFGGLYMARDTSFVLDTPILARFAQIFASEPGAQARPTLWTMAVKGFVEKPIFGWGFENFNYVFNKNYDPIIAGHEQWFDRAHNVFLDWLVATGIVGFVVYLILIGSTIWCVWRLRSLSRLQKSIITGSVAAYLIHNCFVFDNLVSAIMFYSFVAFIHSQYVSQREEDQAALRGKEQKEVRVQRELKEKRVGYAYATLFFVSLVAVPAGIIVAIIMPLGTNKLMLQGYAHFTSLAAEMKPEEKRATLQAGALAFSSALETEWLGAEEVREQFVQEASRAVLLFQNDPDIGADVRELGDASFEQMKELIRKYPLNVRFYYMLAVSFKRVGKYDEALGAIDRAIEMSPRKVSFYEEKAEILLGKKQYPEAVAVARQAYELNKNIGRAQSLLVVTLVYNRQFDEAAALLEMHPGIFNDGKVIEFYLGQGRYADVVKYMPAVLAQYDVSRIPTYSVDLRFEVAQRYLAYSAALLELGRRDEALANMAIAREYAVSNAEQLTQIDAMAAAVRAGKNSILR